MSNLCLDFPSASATMDLVGRATPDREWESPIRAEEHTVRRNYEEHLRSLEAKQQVVRDRVCSVAGGYANGLYLWGPPGVGKSDLVQRTLREREKPFRLTTSHVTPKGLFNLLREAPDEIHVFEEV